MFIFNISDLIAVFFTSCMLLLWIYLGVKQPLKESRCNHDGRVKETSSCDAFCAQCGKNLGFIGSEQNKIRRSAWQDKNNTPWS